MSTFHQRGRRGVLSEEALSVQGFSLYGAAEDSRQSGRFEEAEGLYRKASTIFRRLHNEPHGDLLAALDSLGALLTQMGRPKEAIAEFAEAIYIAQRLPVSDDLKEASLLDNLGGAYYLLGNNHEAEVLRWQSLHLTEKALGQKHPLIALRLSNLAIVVESVGKIDVAEALHLTAIDVGRNSPDTQKSDLATSLMNLGAMYLRGGWFEKSEELLQESLTLYDEAYAREHPSCAGPRAWLGHLHYTLGHFVDAFDFFREAMMIEERLLGFDHETTIITRWWSTRTQEELGLRDAL